jgi:hypothetical protein
MMSRHSIPVGIALFVLLVSHYIGAAEPCRAVRTGTTLPEGRDVAMAVDVGGMYTKRPHGYARDKAGMLGGDWIWNFRLVSGLGVFGKHIFRSVIIDNVTTLLIGHEAGLRLLIPDYLSLEAAYLTHRFEYKWVDGHPFGVGGTFDHGVELGAWGRFKPLARIEIGAHLFGRYFGEPNLKNGHHFADGHWVMGMGARMIIDVFERISVAADLEALRVYRAYSRAGVEKVTWNISESVYLVGAVTNRLGFRLGAQVSTDSYAGQMPVFESKRSMINQPVATMWLGLFFVL